MSVAVADLTTVSADMVAQEQAALAQLLVEAFPGIDFRGAVGQLVLYTQAVVQAAFRTDINRYTLSSSLAAVEADPTLADPGVVSAILSNWQVTPQTGAAASGQVSVVLSALTPVVVPSGSRFSANGVVFQTTQAVAARTDPTQVVADTDRLISPLGNGTFAFTVPVTATTSGVTGMVKSGTLVTPLFSVLLLVSCYAEGDFTGGLDAETTADLVARFQQGVAAKAWSNRLTIDATIRAQPAFAGVLNVSVVGAGDAEMVRDKHSVIPVAMFGRCDCYVRTQPTATAAALTKTATLVDYTSEGNGIWQFSLGRDDVPGFYEVSRVALPSTPQSYAGYEIVDDVRGFDLSGPGFVPDVVNAVEAAYSRYSTTTVRFVDTDTPTAGLTQNVSSLPYSVSVLCVRQIDAVQAFIGSRGVRGPGGDVLVKAPVPCFLTVSFNVIKPPSAAAPDPAPLQAAVATAVNSLRFPGQIAASTLAAAVQALLPPGFSLGGFDMYGRIRTPAGTNVFVRSDDVLRVPYNPGAMVSGRTVAFFLDPADVAVTAVPAGSPEA